jgi:hypothetical protein
MTQPRPSMYEAVAAAMQTQQPSGPPDWWTPDVQTAVHRYGTDPAYREGLPQPAAVRIYTQREAAIGLGLISADEGNLQ